MQSGCKRLAAGIGSLPVECYFSKMLQGPYPMHPPVPVTLEHDLKVAVLQADAAGHVIRELPALS
jgi:hypothetical protein